MNLYIKNMVSLRCKLLVEGTLTNLGYKCTSVELGRVVINQKIKKEQRETLNSTLSDSGLELLQDKKAILVELIKNAIIDLVLHSNEQMKYKFSHYLSEKLGYDYNYLSNLFSSEKGITIEKFIISVKIEHVKELLLYDELSLTEISYKLHYSSLAHLSTQFKKITGLTPTYFKQLADYSKRISIEDL